MKMYPDKQCLTLFKIVYLKLFFFYWKFKLYINNMLKYPSKFHSQIIRDYYWR